MSRHSSIKRTKEIQSCRRIKSCPNAKKRQKSNWSVKKTTSSLEIVSNSLDEGKSLLKHFENGEPRKERWVALTIFCALSCCQSCIWNTWGPIAEATLKVFPSWHMSSVALLSDWGCITYLICCLPCCWLLNATDLSFPIRLAAILSSLATFFRCLSSQEIIFTTTVHLAAILNGLAGVIIGPSTALFSAIWFPTGERTTATGISSAFNQFGIALSYLLGPALVGKPIDLKNETISDPEILRVQIMSFMRIEFVVELLVLIGVLWFFSKPLKKSFRIDARPEKIGIVESLSLLIKNKNMWCLCLAAAFSQGSTGPWLAMITMTFERKVPQNEADNLAFWTVISASMLSLIVTRTMDVFQGHLKMAIYILLLIASATFFWIILLEYKVLIFHKDELYAAVLLGISTSWSTPALFLELAAEIAFPVSEAIVGGYMIFLCSIVAMIFYFSYFIPGIGEQFSSSITFLNLAAATGLIGFTKDEYRRSNSK